MTNFSGLTDELGFMLAKAEIATPEPEKAETSEPEPSQQLTAAGEALNASATWFRAAARDDGALDGRAFLEATSALTPWLDSLGCGITSMVNVNVAKLANFIKHQARGLQIIAVSLKDQFYTEADALVGVAKDAQRAASVPFTLDLGAYA